MANLLEQLIAYVWNWLMNSSIAVGKRDLVLGYKIRDGETTTVRVSLAEAKRAEHIAILGKTGTGKSSLLHHLCQQDISARRGFVFFDLHGASTPHLLRLIASEERRTKDDLSQRLIVIEPADLEFSVGLNVLERTDSHHGFVQIAEFASVLKSRWQLDAFGARTEELLRNALFVLSDSGLTLLELGPLLTNTAFRAACLMRVKNPEVRSYFEERYDQASEAMQAVFRDAVLNKTSAFTSDPCFRHILGQTRSTFSLLNAIDQGCWIILNLDKGRLGEQATTLGSLFLAKLKTALFARNSRQLLTLYCDELQNLVTFGNGMDTLLSESRKFGVSVCSANQYLQQYPASMQAAIQSVATHVCFQLSSPDADRMANYLGGGRNLAELLKSLPKRNLVIKSGHHQWQQALVPRVKNPSGGYWDLYRRCRERWTNPRATVEAEIQERQAQYARSSNEVLHEWD